MSDRFNLWVAAGDQASVICYGTLAEMNDLAIAAGITENVYVLPDGRQPHEPLTLPEHE
jgi:hypothetical protein